MKPEVIRFDQIGCGNLETASGLEWLETNGLGGFASSTIAGMNTRRYHGLLTAAAKPPARRMLLLSKLEETVFIGDLRYELSVNRYPGAVHPQGYRFLKGFRLDPFPVFTYEVHGIEIEKRVFMAHGENTTVVEYDARCLAGGGVPECTLEIRPLIAFRDFHGMTHANHAINRRVVVTVGSASVNPYEGLPTLYFAHDAAELEPTGEWYFNFEYDVERERGLDFSEDLFNPFAARFTFGRRASATIIASTALHQASEAPALRKSETERRAALVAALPSKEPFARCLAAAADQFIVDRGGLKTIVAGYHWFGEWGRDAMITLPGLTLATGRPELAKSILLAFADAASQGMLPNRFPDQEGDPEYNTVDATLWFFEAIRALVEYTGEIAFVRDHLYASMAEMFDWHCRGTRYGIRADEDGLLSAGEPGVQLTWMDAKVGGWVVTPRIGKPVEIQALWYNALRVIEEMARVFGDRAREASAREIAGRARESFNSRFWNKTAGCLYDVVNGDDRDGSVRPNQIFAVSLANTMLEDGRARQVVEVVERELLTPLGLRSLSPRDPRYRPRYEGDVVSRDSAYHQGTVWPWLTGPFITAYVKVNDRSQAAREQAGRWLESFRTHLSVAGVGQISELADGEAPHRPRGAIAQAWSVAELLRAAVQDVYPSGARDIPARRKPSRPGKQRVRDVRR